jgi:hypothetical protein
LVSLHSLVGMLFFLLCSPRAAVYNNVTAALMIVHPQTNSKNNTKQSSQPASARWKERRRPREALQVKRRLAEHQRKIIISLSLAHVRINHTRAFGRSNIVSGKTAKIYAEKECFAATRQFVFLLAFDSLHEGY